MFPDVFLRYLILALPSPERERPTDSTTRHASLGYQMWLGILARLETRHTTPDGKLDHRETANSGFQGIHALVGHAPKAYCSVPASYAR